MDAQGVEIVRGRVGAIQLHGIALAGKDVAIPGVCRKTGEDILRVAIMPETRHRHGKLRESALLGFRLENYELVWFLERQSFEKEVVDQTKDGGVHPDPEGEGEDREESERGRFEQLSESEAEIDHDDFRFWIFDFRLREFIQREEQ